MGLGCGKKKELSKIRHIIGQRHAKLCVQKIAFQFLTLPQTSFQLKIKEALHIGWEKPLLNKQVNQVNLSLSFSLSLLISFNCPC